MEFSQYENNTNLNCVNETDRFSVTNSKAKLTYPIGLLTEPERGLSIKHNGSEYWTGTPRYYPDAEVRMVPSSYDSGASSNVMNKYGVRPVITLKSNIVSKGGDGTYNNPYIVGPVVERNN